MFGVGEWIGDESRSVVELEGEEETVHIGFECGCANEVGEAKARGERQRR